VSSLFAPAGVAVAVAPPPRAKAKADLVYSQTGVGKSYQIAKAADRMWTKYHKRTRLINGDTGGGEDTMGDLVDEGIIIPVNVTGSKFPIETIDKLCQGWWPGPDGKLVAPTPESFAEIGLYAFEGLTSFGDIMLRHFSRNKTRLSQDPSYSYLDGGTEYSGSNMSYYGEVQSRIYDFVVKSSMLPVDRVIWTALEGRGEEEGTKAPTYGPAIAGKKATGKAGQWFGNMIHLEMAVVKETPNPATKQTDLEYKRLMYLQPHADSLTKIPFPAKVRASFRYADKVPRVFEPGDLGALYDFLDDLKAGKK
jgi:hypothetical protein